MKLAFYDHGLCTELAVTMARAGHTVGYYSPNDDAFPKPPKALIGTGLEGVERIAHPDWDKAFAAADAVICPDTRSSNIVAQCIREHKPYWGGGPAERMELDRLWMKEEQRKLGLPVGPYRVIKGIEALINHLKTAKDVWVKVSSGEYRGVIETFHHSQWNGTRAQVLGQLLIDFGADAENITFLIEQPLKGVEVGMDAFWVRGERVGTGYGYEQKDEAYIGRAGSPLPRSLAEVDNALRQHPIVDKACSFVSTEVMDDGKQGVLIDPTIRCPHPPMAGMLELYPQLPLLIEGSIKGYRYGTPKEIDAPVPYVAVLPIRSEWAGEHWTEIEFPERLRRWVKLAWAYKKDGHYYALPGNTFVAYAVALGPTPSKAAENCKKVAESVSCREKVCSPHALDKIIEQTIPAGREVGIPF